jgi:hypothetical protein
MNAPIGNDLDRAIGEQQIQEHAAVLLGVPDAQLAEYFQRALARGFSAQHCEQVQGGLDHEAQLPAVAALAGRDRRLDALQRRGGERSPRRPVIGD